MTRGPDRLPLTPRQAQVLNAAADGASLTTVAKRLGTTSQQIAARLAEAYERLDVTRHHRGQRRAAAVREARRRGLIPAAEPATRDIATEDRAYWITRYDA